MDGTNVAPEQRRADFAFHGRAGEWFGIWIVNILLTILTLGIYSAWAKVRQRRYFYRNTVVAGRSFDYHATGKQILIGRLIVAAGFVAFSVLSNIPWLGVLLLVAFLIALPFLVVRSLRFNAVMSSWSNVRFRFHGKPRGAAVTYLAWPFLAAITLQTLAPLALRAARRYAIGNHSLGGHAFSFDAPVWPFYRAGLITVGWVLAVSAATVAVVFTVLPPGSFAGGDVSDPAAVALLVGFYAVVLLGVLPASFIFQAYIRNAVFAHTAIEGGHRLRSDVHPPRMVWIALSNAVVTFLTLGLMLPWAQVRMARYLANHTTLLPNGALDDLAGDVEAEANAIGDAYADLDGFEAGLPV